MTAPAHHTARPREIGHSHDLLLAVDTSAPARARAHVARSLTDECADSAVIERAMLLVSEVVTDVVVGGAVPELAVRAFATPAGWAVVVGWARPTPSDDPGDGAVWLPLAGEDPDGRRRRRVVVRSGVRWWVSDDGLHTAVGVELPHRSRRPRP